jgi:hypothetical protein
LALQKFELSRGVSVTEAKKEGVKKSGLIRKLLRELAPSGHRAVTRAEGGIAYVSLGCKIFNVHD